MKKSFRSLVMLGVLALGLGSLGTALAVEPPIDTKTDTAQVTIDPNAAGLTVSISASDFANKTYSFSNQTTAGTLAIGLIDLRGTKVGWSVNLKATDFSGAAGTIAVSNLTLTGGAITTNAGKPHGDAPVQTFVTPFSPTSSLANIWTAPATSGDGNYTLNYNTSLNIPGLTLVGTYTSTITVEVPAA